MQVSRWGLPLITNAFIPDMDMREKFNRGRGALNGWSSRI
jgi:hypothetical protein